MRKLSERIEEKLIMLPLREREFWAYYTNEVKALERQLAVLMKDNGELRIKLKAHEREK